jgi:hypothetical protein
MLGGIVVDLQISATLNAMRNGDAPPADLPEKGLAVWRRMLLSSKRQAEAMRVGRSLPMGAQPLLAHYYRRQVETVTVEKTEERVASCLSGFLASGVLSRIQQTSPHRWMPERNEWDPAAKSWELNGERVWSNLDFWIDYGERGFVVFDWKTSTQAGREEALQLATYSVYAQITRSLPRERVLVQAIYLPNSPPWDAKPVSKAECDALVQTVQTDVEFERSRLRETEFENKGRVLWAERESFPATPAPSACLRCRFLELCPDGRAYVASVVKVNEVETEVEAEIVWEDEGALD